MKGGYIMVDCGGLNILADAPQTVNGLYKKVKSAHEMNKPIYAYNCVYGTGVHVSPFNVFVINESGLMICTSSILQVRVASDDTVTVTSLIGG